MNYLNELQKKQQDAINERIEFLLKKHYPELDVRDKERMRDLMALERINIEYSNPIVRIKENESGFVTVRSEIEVKLLKELF